MYYTVYIAPRLKVYKVTNREPAVPVFIDLNLNYLLDPRFCYKSNQKSEYFECRESKIEPKVHNFYS